MVVAIIPDTPENRVEAARLLREARLAILPTDTVYGICADIRQDFAVVEIYRAKGRGTETPLQLLFGDDASLLRRYARLTTSAILLVDALGPGSWTIITAAATDWDSPALAGGRTVGFRVPDSPVIRDVVSDLGAPLAASSANEHGGPSPVTCAEAVTQVGELCAIALDAGPTIRGIDSTVIDCSGEDVEIVREGAIARETVASILGLSDIPVLRSVRT